MNKSQGLMTGIVGLLQVKNEESFSATNGKSLANLKFDSTISTTIPVKKIVLKKCVFFCLFLHL